MEPLLAKCAACNGTGKTEPRKVKADSQFGGMAQSYRTTDECEACVGRGEVLTEAGEAVVNAVKHATGGGK